ncbi:MAG: hypothetical protein QW343_03300 [Candidatus Norongarragalinales archaeon]
MVLVQDYDKMISEEEEYEVEDADDLKEQEFKDEYEDRGGENTAVRGGGEENEEEPESGIEFSYSKTAKKKIKPKKKKPAKKLGRKKRRKRKRAANNFFRNLFEKMAALIFGKWTKLGFAALCFLTSLSALVF